MKKFAGSYQQLDVRKRVNIEQREAANDEHAGMSTPGVISFDMAAFVLQK